MIRKSNIDALFKIGIKAVIPGFINYGYRDGGEIKSAFTNYKILTIHGIVVLITLIYINKHRNHSSALPLSIVNTISKESPVHETCEDWLKIYNDLIYRNWTRSLEHEEMSPQQNLPILNILL